MNDIINQANINHSRASASAGLSSAKTSQGEHKGVDNSRSSGGEDSFQDSIQKAYDDSLPEPEITETDSSGNDLPVSNNLPDSVADDDRLLSIADFSMDDFNDQLSAQNKPIAQTDTVNIQSIAPDIESSADDGLNELLSLAGQHIKIEPGTSNELNILPSHARKLLKIDSDVNVKNTRLITGNVTATIDTIEKSVVQQSGIQQLDISQVNIDLTELPGQKSHVLTTLMQQQQMLANSQTSLLPQTVSAHGELDNDGLPFLLNSSVNNFSTTNLQSIPQTEIVETFARPAWSQGMGKQILWMVNQNISSAEIRLNPAHLGPIEVFIDMSEDQVNVSLSSRHATVREAMEQALPKLREMLDANGFNLAETDISQHSFAEQREQNAENNNSTLPGDGADQSVSSEISEQAIKKISVSTAMVDYYI